MKTAPKIDKEYQKEVVVTKGHDVTLSVPYTGTPTPEATWHHKGQPVDRDASPKILPTINETEASITIKMVEDIDCGEYRLKLSNDYGTVSAEFIVKLLGKCRIIYKPSQPGAPEPMKITNDSVTLHWTEPKEDGGRIIINYIIEYKIKKKHTWVVFNKTVKITETTTTVTKLTREEEYCFRVSAVNEIGTSEPSDASKYVKVCEPKKAEPPVVKEKLTPVVTGLHQEVVLRCVVTANPLPKIEWLKDDKPLTGITFYENFTATFTIKETNESSGGMYTCRARNEAGMAECSATIVIQEAPRFEYDEKHQVQRLCVDEKWHIPIQVIGHPQPTIKWSRNDITIKSTSHVVIRTEVTEGSTDIAIHKLTLEDSAVYTVIAENSAGKAQLSFNLRVVGELRRLRINVPNKIICIFLALHVTDILINI
ncbi:Titin [Chionoecetes opilio]|uniref:Titin n=1 Tax=Chionoecetes opilio TaxID=41210 RepID=A0A8J5CYN7_CHIOP|nr:Titin [Chionoecetes opilio]